MLRSGRRLSAGGCLLLISGCSGLQSSLDPQGDGARWIADLFWPFLTISVIVWTLVMLALGWSLLHRRAPRPDPLQTDTTNEKRALIVIGSATGFTLAILAVLTTLSFFTGKSLAELGAHAPLTIQVIGHQWWWEVRYQDASPSRIVTTANEIHIPVGEPVRLLLQADDVIHSFWVPVLNGKRDLIPGRQTTLTIEASRAGIYRGQCAEFCGLQHAHMGLFVIAQPRADFDAWRNNETAPAKTPTDPVAQRGQVVFAARGCALCHTVRGTSAGGNYGPDLTHVASRRSIAAATLPMTSAGLSAWIADPQAIKPGSHMPKVDLHGRELTALLTYLEGLK